MFFTPKCNYDIWPILEVGPGALPFHLSDVWLDFNFPEDQKIAQSGGITPAEGKPLVYYNGGRFPFKDKAFRYVIASHVIEHLTWENVQLFISELQRVAPAGYIELPRWTWELMNHIPTHLLTGDVINGEIHLFKKTGEHNYNFFTTLLLEKSNNFREYIEKERTLFFCNLEWRKRIPYYMHEHDYPLSKTIKEIADILKNDCERLLDANNTGDVRKTIFDERRTSLLKKILYRIAKKPEQKDKLRKDIDIETLISLLQCPVSGHHLNKNLECECSGFKFEKRGLYFYPYYAA